MKTAYRKEPKSGVVVRVPLADGRFGYMCAIEGGNCWLYDFLSDYPIQNPKYFSKQRWKVRFFSFGLLRDVLDVCEVVISPEEKEIVSTWTKTSEEDLAAGKPPYRIHDPQRHAYWYGTAEDVKGICQNISLSAEKLAPWIAGQAADLEMIHVPPEDRDSRIDPPLAEQEEEYCSIEIVFPWGNPEMRDKLDDMENQLNLELDFADCGTVVGTGYVEGGSADIALDIVPQRKKTALGVIRKVLKRFKVPPDTQILETDRETDEPIEHPLQPPPKGTSVVSRKFFA